MSSLSQSFSEHDEAISAILATFFESSISSARSVHPRYELLWQELSRVAQNGGKRLRPKITILSYQAFGGSDTAAIIPVAAAQEILHASLLIHDDVIDRELYRRGELNITGAYEEKFYHEVTDARQRRHYSDSAALLGGDLLLAATFQLMDQCSLPLERLADAKNVLYSVVFEVAGGQLLDSEAIFIDEAIPAETIARYKTASYSFIGPLLIGATLAGADKTSIDVLKEYAANLGIAYQLHDDLLGVFGNTAETGKSTSSDLREGKRTYIVEQFLAQSSEQDQELFWARFAQSDLTDTEADVLKSLLIQSGAKSRTETRLASYTQLAREALVQLNIDDRARADFELLIDLSIQRNA